MRVRVPRSLQVGGIAAIAMVAAIAVLLGVNHLSPETHSIATSATHASTPSAGARARTTGLSQPGASSSNSTGVVTATRQGHNAVLQWMTPPPNAEGPVTKFVVNVFENTKPDITIEILAGQQYAAGGVSGFPGNHDSYPVEQLPVGATYTFSLQIQHGTTLGPSGPLSNAVAF